MAEPIDDPIDCSLYRGGPAGWFARVQEMLAVETEHVHLRRFRMMLAKSRRVQVEWLLAIAEADELSRTYMGHSRQVELDASFASSKGPVCTRCKCETRIGQPMFWDPVAEAMFCAACWLNSNEPPRAFDEVLPRGLEPDDICSVCDSPPGMGCVHKIEHAKEKAGGGGDG